MNRLTPFFLLLAAGLMGCNPVLVDLFPRSDVTDDDDDTTVGDDDDSQPVQLPVVEILGMDPSTLPVTGTVNVVLQVSDLDSTGYAVTLEFGIEGSGSNWQPATVSNATTAPNVFEEDVGNVGFQVQTEMTWVSADDIPSTTEMGALRACPVDSEGNAGVCDVWPDDGDLPVDNYAFNGGGAFCQPGDLETTNWVGERAFIPLSDGNCLNYQKSDPPQADDFSAQFLLVLVNDTEADANFRISATSQPNFPEGGPQGPPMPIPDAHTPGANMSVLTRQVAQLKASSWANPGPPKGFSPPQTTCVPDLTEADVNHDDRNFYLRDDLSAGSERITRPANLRALGDTIAIYVDEETPMDIDSDCSDPNNPIEPNALPAFGFTNCDLEGVVDVVDKNISPTLTSLFGAPSDVDQNCRVTVFISHRLNALTADSTEVDDDGFVVRSFAEPGIDLWERNLQANPFSNEQEMVYVYAPDPVGFWSENTIPLDGYLNYDLAGRIAVSMQQMISYGRHRGVGKDLFDPLDPSDLSAPDAEDDWLDDAMGLLAADMCGFGSIAFEDAWIYMDRAHLLELQTENQLSDFQDRGGQYLFLRYLVDQYGAGVISTIMDAETTGVDTIEELTAVDFDQFVLQWATALAVSGRTNEAGTPLVPDSVIPGYLNSTTVSVADPENPQPGELFGANGFQQGFNVRGINRTFAGGMQAAGPTELLAKRVRTENLDPLVFHPQADFFGTVAGNDGVAVVLVSGLEQEVNYLVLESEGGVELLGHVIRIEDTSADQANMDVTLEGVDGAKITTVRALGVLGANELDPLGLERRVIGRIDLADGFDVVTAVTPPEVGDDDDSAGDDDDDTTGDDDDDSAFGDDDDSALGDDDDSAVGSRADDDDDDSAGSEAVEITDTDRYSFSLTSVTTIGIWVDRRIASLAGGVELENPFVAVALESDVPDAFDYTMWDFGPNFGVCPDPGVYVPGTSVFNYPLVMPAFVASQGNLSSNPVVEDFTPVVGTGSIPEYTCDIDHDQDGLADADEAAPENLAAQILQRQAENLDLDPNFYESTFELLPQGALDVTVPFYSAAFIDVDSNEEPDDDLATAYMAANVGGRAAETGEEAVWLGQLPPGDYLIIVGGADASTGPYDLSVRVVPPAWFQ